MHHCLNCSAELEVTRQRCPTCGLAYEGRFRLPRLARLTAEQQGLAEELLLSGGNLKQAARAMEMSYPTLRKRLDGLVQALLGLRAEDDRRSQELLDAVEAGRLAPEEASRMIKELRGGL